MIRLVFKSNPLLVRDCPIQCFFAISTDETKRNQLPHCCRSRHSKTAVSRTAHDNDVQFCQKRHCLLIASVMKLFACPWDCVLLESASAEVRTRGMDVFRLGQFMEAKRSELEDFLGDLVWYVHRGPEPQREERVLKARWVLKWSKHRDGSNRDKARLALHGFYDASIATTYIVTSRSRQELAFDLGHFCRLATVARTRPGPPSYSPLGWLGKSPCTIKLTRSDNGSVVTAPTC